MLLNRLQKKGYLEKAIGYIAAEAGGGGRSGGGGGGCAIGQVGDLLVDARRHRHQRAPVRHTAHTHTLYISVTLGHNYVYIK